MLYCFYMPYLLIRLQPAIIGANKRMQEKARQASAKLA